MPAKRLSMDFEGVTLTSWIGSRQKGEGGGVHKNCSWGGLLAITLTRE